MGTMDGVLLVSDFDDTLVDRKKQLPERTKEALKWFVAQGGLFTLASGRGLESVRRQAPGLPIGAPVIVANGTQIYDLTRGKMLFEAEFLETVQADFAATLTAFPSSAVEIFGAGQLCAVRPNEVTKIHLEITGQRARVAELEDIPTPWVYAKFEDTHEHLVAMQRWMKERFGDRYGIFFSHPMLLEITPGGCNKGTGVIKLAELLGIDRANLYCAGDNENDLAMLEAAAVGFTPAGSTQAALSTADVIVCDCDQGAVADVVEYLRQHRTNASADSDGFFPPEMR